MTQSVFIRWRKNPTHQGGFILDGGVHFTAGLRLLLGPSNPLVSIAASTSQLQKHLPPVDTVDATAKAANGATGTLSISFGTTFTASEWSVACEKGVVTVSGDEVTVGQEEPKEVKDDVSGVTLELQAWSEALAAEKPDPRQSPEQALADLELIEAMLRSGEQGGQPVHLQFQSP